MAMPAEANDANTWNADNEVVYHLNQHPPARRRGPRTAPPMRVHGTHDIAGATVEDNTLWDGR
jgi:hypothetical protein